MLLSSSGFMSPWRRKSEPLARSAGGRAHFLELHHLCSRTSLSGAHLHHLHHLLLTHRSSDFCCYLNSSDLCLRPPQLHISSRGRLIELDSVLLLPSSLINEVGGAEKVQAVRWLIYGCRRSRRSSSLCFLHIRLWKSEEAGKREKQVSPAEKRATKSFLCPQSRKRRSWAGNQYHLLRSPMRPTSPAGRLMRFR